ncbi:restriction endonuclease subunit S [Leptospira koniambonensis]|uniref:restriction endonuclease subunit S n=1 Tax=Leptospira koniambonensis TaxID=2484950 RepID=UPI003EBFF6CF
MSQLSNKIYHGGTPSKEIHSYWNGNIPWISSADIDEFGCISITRYITEEGLKNSAAKLVPRGSLIIVNRVGVGKAAIAPFDLCFSQDCLGLMLNEEIVDVNYCIRMLKEELPKLRSRTRGATIQGISKKEVEKIAIPLPPLSEQIQIAEILTQAETLIVQRKESIRLLDELVKSQFMEMFGDPVKNEKGWEVKRLGDVIESIDSGWSPVCEDYPRLIESEKAILKLGAVTKCRFEESANKKLPEKLEGGKLIEIKQGDVLFTRKNTKELVAAACYVFKTPPNLFLSDLIFRLNYNSQYLNGLFLSNLLVERKYRRQIQSLATGSAGSMPNISKERLTGFPLLVPPIEEQLRFAAFVQQMEAQKAFYQNSLNELESLYSSLSQKAFRGELTFARENPVPRVKTQTIEEKVLQEQGILLTLKPTNVDFYKRTILAAEIVWQLHKEPTFGHLKLQKLLYLCIRTSHMQLPVNFSQQAMGPYDPRLMRSIDKQLQEKKWFRYNIENPLKYEPLVNAGQHEQDFQKYYSSEQEGIFSLIKKFKTTKSDTVEIVATLYACLENIVEQEEAFSDALLMKMFYDWSDRKKVFDELEVRKVFKKMRDSGILPKGI